MHKMRWRKGKYLFYLTVLAFILSTFFALSAGVQAAASETPSPNQILEPASAERVSSYFRAAREDFLKGALKDSASEGGTGYTGQRY